MEQMAASWWPALLVLIAFTLTQAYYFEEGYDHHYTYSSETDLLGKKNITTVLKFEIRALNASDGGSRLHSLHVNSLVQFADGGFYQSNPKGWNRTKTFLFRTSVTGSISLVHVHPEDEDELVVIKKAMASIFSVTLRGMDDSATTYKETEQDHLGNLTHNYKVQKTETGKTISRSHFSHERAQRTHQKTLHYDKDGTLHSGVVYDKILLKQKQVYKKPKLVMPGEKQHNVTTSREFPVIWTAARTHIQLDSKRMQQTWKNQDEHSGLKYDTLQIQLKTVTLRLHEVRRNISSYLQCIHKHPEKGDANRTDCVHSVREILRALHKDDFRQFGLSVLNKTCKDTTSRCYVERLLFIDIIARIADDISQTLIVNHVLNKNNPDEEELRHVFIHCIGVEKPLRRVVEAVEKYCFGKDDHHHGSVNLTVTQSRACLAVGSLARNLHYNSNITEAVRLVTKIETWIDKHGNHLEYRQKRSLHFVTDHHYITAKMTLIHSLGNAGHPQSLDRVISMTSPRLGHHDWRRAAVGALRHYTCDRSASALLHIALHDNKQSVRQAAKHLYLKHPRGTSFTKEHENIILSHEYTWPVIARLRRSVLDTVLFQFRLGLPTIDWKKEIGNSDIGASFGVYFENGISGVFRPLSGFFDVTIHDKIWAEAHVGIINFHQDILLIEVCYKGRLEYNMNKFKDFSVGLVENLVGAFDDMAKKIMKPMTDAANEMSSQFLASDGKSSRSNFDPLANAVKEIPIKTGATLNATIELSELVQKYKTLPWVTRLQQVTDQVQSVMEGVNAQALDYYKKVSEAALIALPYAEKEIMDSINKASKLMDQISTYPKQAFSELEKSRLSFQLGMSRIFSSNSKIKEATSLLKARSPSWMSVGRDIGSMVSSLRSVLASASKFRKRKRRSFSAFDQVNDVLDTVGDSSTEIFNKVEVQMNKVILNLEDIKEKQPLALQEGLDKHKLATDLLQNSFKAFQETIEIIKSTIQALFGAKFVPAFPSQMRPSDGSCGKGTYPAGTRNKYKTAGVDLVLEKGWKVVSPVAGLVSKTGNNEVLIQPTDADFKQYEIVISNMKPDTSVGEEAKHYGAGAAIGKSEGRNGCEWPHIHLAVRKKRQTGGDEMCFYMDPSPFVNTLKVKPVWQQECKDFTFKHIGQVFDFKNIAEELKRLLNELKRAAIDWVKDLAVKALEKLIPPNSIFASIPGFVQGILGKIGSLSDVTDLFSNIGNKMKNFFSAIDVKKMDFGKLGDFMNSNDILKGALPKLKGLLGNAKRLLTNLPLGNLKSFATGGLGKQLARLGMAALGGKLASKVQLKTSIFKVCPHFKGGFPFGTDQMCTADEDCLGFTCHINIPLSFINGEVILKVRIHPLQAKVDVSLNGEGHLAPKGHSVAKTGIKLGPLTFSLKSSAQWQGDIVTLSLFLTPCYSGSCLADIKIIKNLQIRNRYKRDVPAYFDDVVPDLEALDISAITDQLANLNIPGGEFIHQVNGMMDGIRSQISDHLADPVGSFTKELDAEDEYEDSQDYPNGRPLYIPFFPPMKFPYPAGPVVFMISFDAGAELGQDITADVQAVKSTITTKIAPFVVGKVKASMAISIVIASAGISLTGWLMRTSFPFILEVNYAKLPTIETKKLLVELTPLELKLRAFVKILFVINLKFNIWHWKSPTMTGTIWVHSKEATDDRPPRFPNCDSRKRSISGSCSIRQLVGRHPGDTAFLLEVDSKDDSSPLTLHYSVGTAHGGRDVRSLVEMRGSSLTVPTSSLPNGVPLHWTVRARNTQGGESTTSCMLPTYDNTIPDGRVDAAYQFTSHRTTIQGNIVVFEDSVLQPKHLVAVGYSPGEFGKELKEWNDLFLTKSNSRPGESSDLKYFAPARKGKLSSVPFSSGHRENTVECAKQCVKVGLKCVSFDYEMHTQTCDLQETVIGARAKFVTAGSYLHHERLGVGYSTFVAYTALNLEHGAQYYINAQITNVLNYTAYLPSSGTLADFTPPEPGPVGDTVSDILVADECEAAVTQQCIDGNKELNHRKIVDGPGGRTVFNGNRPLQDGRATLANNFISGNCDGFHDDESGVWGYTWAAGTSVCGSDVVSFRDPHTSLQTRNDWTHTGLGKNLHLPDGPYYITFQAINNVVHGGALVTTVCHSYPYKVDTTPPYVHEVGDLLFDEDFDILGVYFNVSDDGSGIARVDFGLGKTKYDVFVTSYSRHHFMTRDDPYLVIEDLALAPGVQAWVRIRAVNNVDLFTASHGDVPILIDFTPPVKGRVLDGDKIHQDIDYQHDITRICAQWVQFYDPESGIDSYLWGVGSARGLDDIVPFENFTHRIKSGCSNRALKHNTTYYSTVIAVNGALNQKQVEETSDGVLVDITPPVEGFVYDGPSIHEDIDYSSKTATLESCWDNFTDPESHVREYAVTVYINDELKKVFSTEPDTSITDHTLHMKHLDTVRVDVTAINGAELETLASSDGYLIDVTPPRMIYLKDSATGRFQKNASYLTMQWYCVDDDSGIANYRYTIFEKIAGQKEKFWPDDKLYDVTTSRKPDIKLESLSLVNGAIYSVSVTALNNALLSTKIESRGVLIDSTNPTLNKIIISLPGEEEEVDDQGNVVHIEGEPLHVSWTTRDPESGIVNSLLCIADNVMQCTGDEEFVSYGTEVSVTADARNLVASSDTKYVIIIKVINGAGLTSEASSKPITVLKGNSPGAVYDGRYSEKDANYQQDISSLSISFAGFESEACGITSYDWGIGTEPFITDIMRFTNYGLTMLDDGSGYAETSNTNFDNVQYFFTVRAITGESCHDSYIVSSSDGVTVDRKVPAVVQEYEDVEMTKKIIFQNHTDYLPVSWNVDDKSGISSVSWSISSYPGLGEKHVPDISKTQLDPEDTVLSGNKTYFVTIFATDMANNKAYLASPPVTVDTSPSVVRDFLCTPSISVKMATIACVWSLMEEYESKITSLKLLVGSSPSTDDITASLLSTTERSWTFEVNEAIKESNLTTNIFVTFEIVNEAHLKTRLIKSVSVDYTVPLEGNIRIVTSGDRMSRTEKSCQVQTSYVSVVFENFADDESDIDRYEIGLGTNAGLTDIYPFTAVKCLNGMATLHDLQLLPSSLAHVTARIFNKAGLYTVQNGGAVAVSPEPYITILDGPGSHDVDSQHDLSVIQGSWVFSDLCQVVSAEWAVEDITGELVKDFEHTPGDGPLFYNDELTLENLRTYIVKMRIVDAINRTISGRSDGVIVQIQPPVPGYVRDGLDEDINYQLPTDYLATNWDPFGNKDVTEPSQEITYYEVAIGDDRRYEETRSNVHFYENVRLNTSYVFHHLNLTAKTQVYFITVRGHSAAGSFEESFSNGIRVGYGDEILAGEISINPYQSSTSTVRVTWSDFVSDVYIREYHVAVHTNDYEFENTSTECSNIQFIPLVPFRSVGRNTIVTLENLNLNHSQTYFIIVKAEDEAGICLLAASDSVTIDTTPPSAGDVSIEGGRSGGLMYARKRNILHVNLTGFLDEESLIDHYTVQLLGGSFCSGHHETSKRDIIESVIVSDPEANFNDIYLDSSRVYYTKVASVNKAGLSTIVTSSPIVADFGPPDAGNIKIGFDWEYSSKSWSNVNELQGTLAVNVQPVDVICDSQREIMGDYNQGEFTVFGSPFESDAVTFLSNYVQIYARHDPSLSFFQKGGVSTRICNLMQGNYSFSLQVASENKVSTLIGLAQNSLPDPDVIIDGLNKIFIENCTESTCGENSDYFVDGNWNFGLLFTLNSDTFDPLVVYWAKDRSSLKVNRVQVDTDPRISKAVYTFHAHNSSTRSYASWDIDLYINGEFKGQQSGLDISGDMTANVFTWNMDGFVPSVNDPFDPFTTNLVLSSMKFPLEQNSVCRFGKIFSDSESGIKDIYIGLSNSQNETANILPYRLYETFCVPCKSSCVQNCNFVNSCEQRSVTDSSIHHFTIENLTLTPSVMVDPANYTDTEPSAYYIDVKVTDHAGYTTEIKSDAVIIDTTPPVVTDVTCYDPDHSLVEPAPYLGNDHSVAASWEISEDFSEIRAVYVSIGDECGADGTIVPMLKVKLKTVTFHLTDKKFLNDYLYHVSVTAYNTAGLNHTSCCNFTTDFRIPVSPPSKPQSLYTSSETVPGLDVGITEYNDRVGLQWDDPVSDVEYFEWELVSVESQMGIYPSLRVGSGSSRRVEIIKGDILVEDGTLKTSVSEYLNRNLSDGLKSSDFTNGPLSLEPGKCVAQTVTCVSRAHLKTDLSSQKICVKRKTDVLLIPGNKTIVALAAGGAHVVTETPDPDASTISVTISEGALTVGVINDEDVQVVYGAPAAASYLPYIVNPDTTFTQLSRYLTGRLVRFVGTTFHLSPVTDVRLEEDIRASLSNADGIETDDNQESNLIFWDSIGEVWRHLYEVCKHPSKTNARSSYTFSICNAVFAIEAADPIRGRRETTVYPSPRMFSGAIVRSSITNTPPVIDTEIIYCLEDTDIVQAVKYHDLEADGLAFAIGSPPRHGIANISSEGTLFYSPDDNFNGMDSVILEATEVFVNDLGMQPHQLTKRIYVNVSSVNDQPVSFFQEGLGIPIPSYKVPVHNVYLEGNLTDHVLGSFWIADVDEPETLRLLQKDTSGIQANYSLVEIQTENADEIYNNMTVLYSKQTISNHHLNLATSTEYHGNINFSIHAVDSMNSYSHLLTVAVFVLVSPCYHGICVPTAGFPCSHPTRAVTFESYKCQCEAGYEGEFCKKEINECKQATCSLLYDCVDRLAYYDCVLNFPKIIAIFMCILLPVGGVSFFIWRRYKKMKSRTKLGILPEPHTNPVFCSGDDGGNADTNIAEESTEEMPQAAETPEPEPEDEQYHVRPGYAPMPHRRGVQLTSGLCTKARTLTRVEI